MHASNEKDSSKFLEAAREGAWISIDNLNENNVDELVKLLRIMKNGNLLNKALVSHDAGWFDPAKENGGKFRGFTTLFEKLVPALQMDGFSEREIKQLLVLNPAKAFEIRIRRI